ncbi:alpha/beta hydrolase [Paucilactobacillus suebicus]|uniref:alpha/beta hydrolase n=1 Tax=Paucilactobacillus suebicus TaxID=152335 RepID=UPI0002490E3B|nr:alpha/beta hydrolase [Paucilactobacillus suebicus]
MKKKTAMSLMAPLVVAAGTMGAAEKLYSFAFNRVDKVPETSAEKQKYADQYYDYVNWLNAEPIETWHVTTSSDDIKLSATYLPATIQTTDSVIIAHGYKGNGETMANYAKMFHELGYNVLMPDDRAHGKSSGKYISFGWLDRLDYQDWINKLIDYNGKETRIVLYGVSMGGATMEMLSGEKLPEQVRCIIADCGYSNIDDEMSYLLKKTFHLPKYPFLPAVSAINLMKQGFQLKQVSSINQLKHNYRPILFIHGEKDSYVPLAMVDANFAATRGPKQKWIVKDATHAESFWVDPERYKERVQRFIDEYISYTLN